MQMELQNVRIFQCGRVVVLVLHLLQEFRDLAVPGDRLIVVHSILRSHVQVEQRYFYLV
jgi:hypothetical protein